MNNIVIACRIISDEVNMAISRTGVSYPIIWIDSILHEYPDKLRAKLQEEISKISHVQNIILAFGYCGNAVLGLKTENASLIIPRIDDCISLLIGSKNSYHSLSGELGAYYLTKGWLEYENGVLNQFERNVRRFGADRAYEINKIMLQHYSRLILIDTGAYCVDSYQKKVQRLSEILNIDYEVFLGSGNLLDQLLLGPWEKDFSVIPRGGTVTKEHLWAKKDCQLTKGCKCNLYDKILEDQ